MSLEAHNATIAQLTQQLVQAEREKAQILATKRREVTSEIAERLRALDTEFREIQKLGASVEIVVYFSPGYEEFSYVDKEDWNSSSMHC